MGLPDGSEEQVTQKAGVYPAAEKSVGQVSVLTQPWLLTFVTVSYIAP